MARYVSHADAYNCHDCPGWLDAINNSNNSLFLTMGPGDLLVHHAIALGLHAPTLILVKAAFDARGLKLMPDTQDFGYTFPCDGPAIHELSYSSMRCGWERIMNAGILTSRARWSCQMIPATCVKP